MNTEKTRLNRWLFSKRINEFITTTFYIYNLKKYIYNMKNKYILFLSPVIAFFFYLTLSSYSGGITGRSTIGCGPSGCHNSVAVAATILSITGLPPAGYVNGSVYSLTFTITNTSIVAGGLGLRDGFDMTASAGSFTAITGTALNGVTEIRHSTPKAAPGGTTSWTFNWTAPASGSATVTFNAAGNATNGDGGSSSLDKWNVMSTTLIKAPLPLGVNATSSPSILCNGGVTTITASSTNGTAPIQFKLNAGAYQSISSFPNTLAGTYTVTAIDATTATATTVITINQPSAITFNSPTITNPLCNTGNGSVQLTATGGIGATKTYTITPLGPQTNTTGNFTGLTGQTYTVTATDLNSCTKTTVITITPPAAISFLAPSVTDPTCNGGSNGGIQIIALGGTGTKFYSVNPLGPQTNATGTFSGLTAQNYTITVIDANSCSLTTTAILNQPAPITVTSSNVNGCQGSPIALIGSPAGGTFSLANPYTGPSTTYTYSYTNGIGCSATSSPSTITTTPVTNSSIVMPASSAYCETLTQVSGTNIYSNTSCELITSIIASGLGNTNACINFLSGSPTWNSEPYANRVYSITPTTQPTGGATICLYYTAADLTAAGISLNSDISITKVGGNGVLGGSGSVTEIPNSSMTINTLFGGTREVCFPVSSFSSFYLHSKNPGNVPLPVNISDFKGQLLASADLLTWKTSNELNNDYFNIQHSKNGIDFETIGRIESKSLNGNSVEELNYNFTNLNSNPAYNFYRLEQIDIDGRSSVSALVSLYRQLDENSILIYPNPTSGEFTITSESPMHISIFDINGKQVFEKQNSISTNVQLQHAGIYMIKLTTSKGQVSMRKLIVE